MKAIVKLLVILLVLVVIAAAGAIFMINSIAKTAIESQGSGALGVKTTVDSVGVSLLGASAKVNALQINNPEGFNTPYLVNIGGFSANVDAASILGDKIVVPLVEITGLKVNIEQQGLNNNVSALMNNIKSTGGGKTTDQKPAQGGRNVAVRKIVLRNIEANVQLLPVGGSAGSIPVKVDELVLDDVTENGMPIGQLLATVVPAVFAGIVEKSGGAIPPQLAGILKGDIAGTLGALGGDAAKLLQGVGGDVGKLIKDLPDVGKDAAKQIQGATEGLKGATEGLKGLFGGDKKK